MHVQTFLRRAWSPREVRWLLVAVVALAAAARLWQIGAVPFAADEFLDVNATAGYHHTGRWQAWDFNRGEPSVRDNKASDERAMLYRWQVANVYRFAPVSESSARAVSVAWGIITTLVIYSVAVRLFKSRAVGIVAAFLWAVSVPAIEINRTVRMYSMFAPVFLLLWWSVFHFMEGSLPVARAQSAPLTSRRVWDVVTRLRWPFLVPVVILAAASYHLHSLTGNLALMVAAYVGVMIVVSPNALLRWRYGAYLGALGVGAVALALLAPRVWAQFLSGMTFFDDHWGYMAHIARTYWHPLLGAAALVGGGIFALCAPGDRRAGLWTVSTFVAGLAAAIFLWNRNVGAQYIFFLQPIAMILAALGVVAFARWMARATAQKAIFAATLIVSAIFLPYYGYFFQTNTTYRITMTADRANYRKVFTYVRQNARPDDVLITRNFRNFYWKGMAIPVFDFGSERSARDIAAEGKVKKITRVYVEEIVAAHPSGWVVLADNDEQFVEKEARQYFKDHFHEVTNSHLVRGKVTVYRWGETPK